MMRKNDTEENKFNWLKIRWIRYTKEFETILYKTSLNEDEPFKHLNIKRRGINNISLNVLELCYITYMEDIKNSHKKKKVLLDTLNLIHPTFHSFYKDLKCENMPNFHPDLT